MRSAFLQNVFASLSACCVLIALILMMAMPWYGGMAALAPYLGIVAVLLIGIVLGAAASFWEEPLGKEALILALAVTAPFAFWLLS